MKRIIILAGSLKQFNYWCDEMGINPKNPKYIYADRPEKILGIEAEQVIEIGTFYERSDAREMRERANSRIR